VKLSGWVPLFCGGIGRSRRAPSVRSEDGGDILQLLGGPVGNALYTSGAEPVRGYPIRLVDDSSITDAQVEQIVPRLPCALISFQVFLVHDATIVDVKVASLHEFDEMDEPLPGALVGAYDLPIF
jgi:hypothetical protein